MSVATIRAGLQTRLATVAGLRTPDTLLDQINPPLAWAAPETIDYDETFGASGLDSYTWIVTVIVARISERTGQALLDEYIDPTSTKSIKKAIEADRTLGGAAHTCRVVQVRNYGPVTQTGEVMYLGAEFVVSVTAA